MPAASVPRGARRRRQHAAGEGPIGGGRRVVSLADIIGIRDAPQTASGGCGLALLVTDEGAVAQAGLIVALNAKRIARADRVRRRDTKRCHAKCCHAKCCHSARDQQDSNHFRHSNHFTHLNRPKAAIAFHQYHRCNWSGTFTFSSTHSHTSLPFDRKMRSFCGWHAKLRKVLVTQHLLTFSSRTFRTRCCCGVTAFQTENAMSLPRPGGCINWNGNKE